MGTKSNVTLTPDRMCRASGMPAQRPKYGNWRSVTDMAPGYSGYVSNYAFRLPTPAAYAISDMRINISVTTDEDSTVDVNVYLSNGDPSGYYYSYGQDHHLGEISFYSSSSQSASRTISLPYDEFNLYGSNLYLVFVLTGGKYTCQLSSVVANVAYHDLSIDSISPETIQTAFLKDKTVKIEVGSVGEWHDIYDAYYEGYADGTVSLTANGKTIATCKLSDGTAHNVEKQFDGVWYSIRLDRFTFNCTTDWFKTIASTNDTITVTVTIEDESMFNRKGTGTFEIIKPPLSIEANESNVVMSTSSYETNEINVTGDYSGKFTVTVKHGNTTESPYQIDATNRFDVSVQRSWFYNQSFTSTNITVTLQDEIYRVRQATFTASLPTLEISLDRNGYDTDANSTIYVTLSNAVGSASISCKIGSGSWEAAGSSISLSPSIFADTKSNQLSVTIKAEVPGYRQSAQTSTTVAAGANVYPQISYMVASNVPNIHMPSEYASDYVQGYSKVAVSVQYTKGAASISDPPDLKLTGLGEAVTLTKNGSYYKATTTSVITRETTLTVTVTDTMGRRGQQTYTIKEDDIVKLPNITIRPSSTSVEAGEDVSFEIEGFVGTYDISFMSWSKKLTGGGTGQYIPTFAQEANVSWFDEVGVTDTSLSVTVVVTDVLGRKPLQSVSLSVRLPTFKIELDKANVLIYTDLTMTIKGSAGQAVSMVFTTPKDEETVELYRATVSETTEVVRCPQRWFTGFDKDASLPITISATAGSQSTTAQFSLDYPALGLAIRDTSDQAVTSATVGDNLKYIFSNLEGETVNIDYVYPAQNNRSLLQYGPYSTAQTIATPQLFDMASPPVTKSPSMQVNIVISDARQRTATVSNFIINASDSMRPVPSNLTITPVNDGVDAKFADDFINNVTKYIATVTITPRTNAKIPESNVFLEFNSKRVQMRSIGNNQYQYASNDAIDGTEESPFSDSMALETFTVKATDERGMSLSSNLYAAVSCYVYNLPNAKIGYHRCNQDGTPNDSGDYCIVTCDYTFTGIWADTFPPSPQNEGYVTVSTSNYEETKQFDFTKWEKAQFTLVAGYGLNDSGEVVSNPLRAATTTPYIVPEATSQGGFLAYKVTFNGDYVVEYARWEGSSFIRKRTINSSGQYISAGVGESLYISLKRSNETSESAPVDIAEANVQLTLDLGNSEDGSFEFLIPNMSIEQTYQITVTLADLIASTIYTVTLSTGGAIMDFYHGGKGVAIGKVAEHENMLEINPEWEVKAGKITLKIGSDYVDLSTLLGQIKQQLGI